MQNKNLTFLFFRSPLTNLSGVVPFIPLFHFSLSRKMCKKFLKKSRSFDLYHYNPITNLNYHPIKMLRVLSYHRLYLCMCTKNTISQFSLSRQCTSRYTIHARHQLCVKGFCYLRTVRVTAAICFSLWAGIRHYTSNVSIILARP